MFWNIKYLCLLVLFAKEYSTVPTVAPRFRDVQGNVTVKVGQTAVLPCSIVHQPNNTRVVWLDEDNIVLSLNERTIADDRRISVDRPHWGDWNLVIRATQLSDQGTYFCLISTMPVTSKRLYLTVLTMTTTVKTTVKSTTSSTSSTGPPNTSTQLIDTGRDSTTGSTGPPNTSTQLIDNGRDSTTESVHVDDNSGYTDDLADTHHTVSTAERESVTVSSDVPTASTDTGNGVENIHGTTEELDYGKQTTTDRVTTTDLPTSDTVGGYSTAHPGETKGGVCSPDPADLVFLLDASNSIWLPDFERQKLFVERVVRTFDVGPGRNRTRVGALTFGHGVWPKFYLHTYSDLPAYISAIRRIRHGRGNRTNTGDALVFTRDIMFSERAGSRENVTKIAVVLSDGRSQATVFTQETAIDLQKRGITLFAVSVGFRRDHKELATIASDPDNRYYFSIDDYSELSSIKDRMTKAICGDAAWLTEIERTYKDGNLPSDKDPSTQVCSNKIVDINFMVDSSYSISKENFAKEMEFVHSIIDVLDIGANKTRVGVMSFSDTSEFHIKLDTTMSKDEYQMRLNSVTYVGGGTDTAKALRRMREQGFVSSSGDVRENAARIIIVLTDGLSLTPDVTAREADIARKTGIQIFSIGIGNGVDKRELADIASDPDEKYVLHVDDFWALDDIKKRLSIRACTSEPMAAFMGDPAPTAVCAPFRQTDLLFVYDAMTLGSWRTQTISQFLVKSLNDMDLVSGKLRVGRVIENCIPGNIPLGSALQSTDLSSVEYSTFDKMLKGVTRIGFSVENGGRENASKMVVIFLDDDMRMDFSTLQAAKQLKESVDFFYVVAVGHNMRMMRLVESAGDGKFINVNSYEDLFGKADKLQGDMCDFFFTNAAR